MLSSTLLLLLPTALLHQHHISNNTRHLGKGEKIAEMAGISTTRRSGVMDRVKRQRGGEAKGVITLQGSDGHCGLPGRAARGGVGRALCQAVSQRHPGTVNELWPCCVISLLEGTFLIRSPDC